MKKITLTLFALVCALCCVFGLAACNDDSAKKNHTEEQWQAAISTPITEAKSFNITQSYSTIQSDGTTKPATVLDLYVYNDSVNTYYYMESEDEDYKTDKSYLLKKGERYYSSYNEKYTEEISAQSFAEREGGVANFISDAQLFIDQLKTRYGEFDMRGSSSDSSGYYAENMEFTVTRDDKTHNMTANMVDVWLDNETGVLTGAYIRELLVEDDESDVKQLVTLSYDNNYGELKFELPELPEFVGKTFYLAEAEVDNDEYEEAILGNYNEHTHILYKNDGKTVTFNADGTFTGDIEFNGISITTYTWTDETGSLTISNEKNAQVPAEGKTTLHGCIKIIDPDTAGLDHYALVIETELNLGNDITVTLTLELLYKSQAQ